MTTFIKYTIVWFLYQCATLIVWKFSHDIGVCSLFLICFFFVIRCDSKQCCQAFHAVNGHDQANAWPQDAIHHGGCTPNHAHCCRSGIILGLARDLYNHSVLTNCIVFTVVLLHFRLPIYNSLAKVQGLIEKNCYPFLM